MDDTPANSMGWGCDKLVSEQDLRKPMFLSIVVFVYTILHYWKPCIFKLKVHTYEVIQSIKQLIFFFFFFANTALCQAEDVKVVLGESFHRFPSVLQYLREMST